MILILSDKHDVHADVVEKKLIAKHCNVFRFNLDVESLQKTIITFYKDNWLIEQNDKKITSDKIKVVWYRRVFVELLLEEKVSRNVEFLIWKNEWNKILLGFYLSISHLPSLCPLKQSYAAENKFLQYRIAKEIGFKLPEFITSNAKLELLNFAYLKKENVVLKLHHQDFYKVGDSYKGIYVNLVNTESLKEFKDIGENPITLQEYISKQYEVRYTVVGDNHFCCKIDSQKSMLTKVDWRRYDIPNTPHSIISPPDKIKKQVVLLMKKLELNYGALDFIVDENDEWFFLEINSMGQWLWIEDLTGLQISDAICNWLILNQ